MTPQKVEQLYQALQANNPNPTTELLYRSPFELLIAVMLSAQATDVSVNKATRSLFKLANTAEQMAALSVERIKTHIKTIGLYNTKAENVRKTSKLLVEHHDGEVPQTRQALEQLPGVGRKTANVILNTAFGHDTIAVDTHIFRVANRTGLAQGKTPEQIEQQLLKMTPKPYVKNAHHWLILHGRYTCKARKPACFDCVIRHLCEYQDKPC